MKIKLTIIVLLFLETLCFGQNNVNSPYTMFGIGYIEPGGFGRSKAMGGTGIALPSDYSLNNLNPASYSSIDSLHFFLETGITALYSNFNYGSQNQSKSNANFSYLAIGFRINRWWGSSVGLAPYSNIGYNINTRKQIEGTSQYSDVTLSGSGGLNQFYWSNSFKVHKNISVGINASYLFGSISQNQKTMNDYISGNMEVADETSLRNICLNYGAQYRFKLHEKVGGSLGAVFGTKTKLNLDHDITILDNNGDTLANELTRKTNFYIPQYFGLGGSLVFNKKLLLTGDYTQSDWSGINKTESGVEFVDSRNVAFGVEYLPSYRLNANYFQTVKYRMGVYNEKSYLRINGHQLQDYGITAGMSFPIRRSKIFLNIAFSTGIKGDINSQSIINETYYKLHLNFTLFDYWFNRIKFD